MEPPSQSRSRIKWIQLGTGVCLLLIVIGLAVYLNSNAFRVRVRKSVVSELEQITGGRVELESFTWRFSNLLFDINGLTIHGLEKPGDIPYAHFKHAHVRLKIINLLGGRIGLRDVQIQQPVFHIIVNTDGSTNQPRPKLKGTGRSGAFNVFDVAVDHLEINDGHLVWNDRHIPFNVRAQDVGAFMAFKTRPARYVGEIHSSKLEFDRQHSPEFTSQAAAEFVLQPNSIEIPWIRWSDRSSHIEANAKITDLQNPHVTATYHAVLDARDIANFFQIAELRSGVLDINGTGRYISVENLFASGKVLFRDGIYSAKAIHVSGVQADSDFAVDADRITLPRMNIRALGGSLTGQAAIVHWNKVPASGALLGEGKRRIPTRSQQGSIELKASSVQVGQALAALFPPKSPAEKLRIASVATGSVEVKWTGTPKDSKVNLNLEIEGSPHAMRSELPLTGAIQAAYSAGEDGVNVASATLAARATRLSATGRLDKSSQLRVSLNATDLSEIDPVIHAFGGTEPLPALLHGRASFNGVVSGNLSSPGLSGRLQATDFDTVLPASFAGSPYIQPASSSSSKAVEREIHWDSLTANLTYSATLFAVHNALIKTGESQISADGEMVLTKGVPTPDSTLQLKLAARDADLSVLQPIAGMTYPITGTTNARIAIAGHKNDLSGSGHVELAHGSAYGEPYRSASTDLTFRGSGLQFQNFVAEEGGGHMTGSATYDLSTRAFTFTAEGKNFELANLTRIQTKKLSVAGKAEFRASGSGTLEEPAIDAHFQLTRLVLSGDPAGDIVATAVTHGSDMHLEAHTNMQAATLDLNGNIHLRDDFPAEIHAQLAKFDFDPLLKIYLAGKVTGHSSLSGALVLRGPLKNPRAITVQADINQFSANVQNVTLQNDGPLRFSVGNGVATVQQAHIVGNGTDITGSGTVEFFGAQSMDLHAKGHANLAMLRSFKPDLMSSGQMGFTVNATGRLTDPSLSGNVQFIDGALSLIDLPNGLSQMNGTLNFDKNRLRVQKLTARSGGGELQLGGYVTYANGLFVDLTVSGRDIRMRYPEGISSQETADLRLVGTAQSAVLSGDVTVTKFGITPQFDLATYVERAKQQPITASPDSTLNNVRLDVHVVSTPELRVETSLARLSGDVDLRLRGTAARPSVLGRVSLAEGDVTFNGTTYHLERGDILFANPVRIEPVVNVEASARVRDYDITLGFHGTPDKLNVTYRSEPPLPSADIIALLAFGRTRQEGEIQAEQGSQAATEQSFAVTASNAILGEALNSAVSSRVQKLFGISRIKIDPNLGGTEENPNARLTIEQQISNNVTVTYLTNLGQTAQQVLQVEYNINKNVAIVALRDYTGVLAIDLRIRQRKR